MLKRFALVPSERLKECRHEHMRYRGAIPCTGPRVCSMCGAREDDLAKRDYYFYRYKYILYKIFKNSKYSESLHEFLKNAYCDII